MNAHDYFVVLATNATPEPYDFMLRLDQGGPAEDGPGIPFWGEGEVTIEYHGERTHYPWPPGAGIWIWEGRILEDKTKAELDVWPFVFDGAYRRPTADELQKLCEYGTLAP